jgi:hypothetical protein
LRRFSPSVGVRIRAFADSARRLHASNGTRSPAADQGDRVWLFQNFNEDESYAAEDQQNNQHVHNGNAVHRASPDRPPYRLPRHASMIRDAVHSWAAFLHADGLAQSSLA